MWYIYMMEYYSAIKINVFMKILGNWVELVNILSVLTQNPPTNQATNKPKNNKKKNKQTNKKTHTWYGLIDKWISTQKFRLPKIQFTDQMKVKKKEDHNVDTSIPLIRGIKIPMGGDIETKGRIETKGKAI